MSYKRRETTGFTIAELMVAIVLIVTAMAIVGPPTARTMQRSTLQAAVDEITSTHDMARAIAMQTGRPARLLSVQNRGGNSGGGLLSVEADTTGNGLTSVRRTTLRKASFVTDRMALCFDARGLPTTRILRKADGTFKSCNEPDATFVVRVGALADTIRYSPLGERLR